MSAAVEIEQITKSFGSHVAVDALSLQVPANSIYGFIGPNGSGKTTTLRMIMRIFFPDSGHIRVLGEEVWHAASDRVAYLPEERGLYKKMKVREVLHFYAELKGARDCTSSINRWLGLMGLSEWGDKRVETLSKGMSQKVQFIATVIAKPSLVLLDEPFSGLDPVNAEVLRDAILNLKKEGTTVIFSTHDMAVAERMCDFIFMIYKGKKVLDGTLESIQDKYGEDTIRVRIEGGGEGESVRLNDLPGVAKVTDFGRLQELQLERGGDSQTILAALMRRGKVLHFERTRPSLHEIFVRIAAPVAETM
ncbi:MAG: ATP-binding cassette domain-containing protein [Planctomycetes bacterium]|nr:ATP-binding cassette domain-containing protein [Planctomycetota bacterium]